MKRVIEITILVAVLILVDVSSAQGDSLPDSAYVNGLLGHAQSYALSCESRSAADLAGYWGISVGETQFLHALPQSDNPDKGFVGSPDDSWGNLPPQGYGVHAAPVAKTLREFGLYASAHQHLTWDDLRSEINAGRPVIVWVIGSMWSGTPVEYQAPDGSSSMVAAFEHTMILTGYNNTSVQVLDAYTGQYETFGVSAFLNSWSVLGNMAVFAVQVPEPTTQPAESQAVVNVVNYQVRLPIIQMQSSTLSHPVVPGKPLHTSHEVNDSMAMLPDWQLVDQLRVLLLPFSITPVQFLW